MPETDNTNTRHPELPELATIEAEGKEAVQELAHAFVRQTLRNGGRIDLARLDRAGPSVQAAYRRMLAQVAAKAIAPPKPAPAGAAGERDEEAAVVPPPEAAGDAAGGEAVLPRAEKGWHDQCRAAMSFKIAARRRGRLSGAIVTAAVLAGVAWLQR